MPKNRKAKTRCLKSLTRSGRSYSPVCLVSPSRSLPLRDIYVSPVARATNGGPILPSSRSAIPSKCAPGGSSLPGDLFDVRVVDSLSVEPSLTTVPLVFDGSEDLHASALVDEFVDHFSLGDFVCTPDLDAPKLQSTFSALGFAGELDELARGYRAATAVAIVEAVAVFSVEKGISQNSCTVEDSVVSLEKVVDYSNFAATPGLEAGADPVCSLVSEVAVNVAVPFSIDVVHIGDSPAKELSERETLAIKYVSGINGTMEKNAKASWTSLFSNLPENAETHTSKRYVTKEKDSVMIPPTEVLEVGKKFWKDCLVDFFPRY